MAKRKTARKNRKSNKKMKGGLGLFDVPKVIHLHNIIKSDKEDEQKETEFKDYISTNKTLLTDINKYMLQLPPSAGNIIHTLAAGEYDTTNDTGCIILPDKLAGYQIKGFINDFNEFLTHHPKIIEFIRETGALSQEDKEKRTPLQVAKECKNWPMLEALKKGGRTIKRRKHKLNI